MNTKNLAQAEDTNAITTSLKGMEMAANYSGEDEGPIRKQGVNELASTI
jgi:hypothetical protein